MLNVGDIKHTVYFLEHDYTRIIYPIGKRLAIKMMEKDKLDDQYEMKYIKLNEEVPPSHITGHQDTRHVHL